MHPGVRDVQLAKKQEAKGPLRWLTTQPGSASKAEWPPVIWSDCGGSPECLRCASTLCQKIALRKGGVLAWKPARSPP